MDKPITYIYTTDVKDMTVKCLLRIGYNLMNIKNGDDDDNVVSNIKEICAELIVRKNNSTQEEIDKFLYYTISPNC